MRQPEVIAKRQAQMRAAAGRSKRGRPRLPLDPLEVFEWAQVGLSNREIAARLGCSHKTVARRFGADLERARLRRRALLQMKQMRLIEEEKSWAALQAQLKFWRATPGQAGAKHKLFSGEK